MALLTGSLLALRRDPRLLSLPPYLSLACIVVGVVWLLMLPLNEYSRSTYISENALLPGQVHTYYSGSEYDIFEAYKFEVMQLQHANDTVTAAALEEIWRSSGLKTARQRYAYRAGGEEFAGQNLYAVLRAPRGDATEAVVLVASMENMEGIFNGPGVTLAMALSRYFKRWSLWSKDIIFLITPDSKAGTQAWVDAYHDRHDPATIDSLPLKSGALQGAVVIDYPHTDHFKSIHISYDGINGQLSNLDLFNTVVNIANGQHGMGVALQEIQEHDNSYLTRVRTILRGMLKQGLGHASGPHSVFVPYHVDAVTLKGVGEGPEDEAAFGRVVESTFRSLNNLMEHFHQSFFFYLLMEARRFVSIGTYLPSAMLVSANFTITAIALWVASGRPVKSKILEREQKKKGEVEVVEHRGATAVIPKQELQIVDRDLFLPGMTILALHFLGVVPLYLFNNATRSTFEILLYIFGAVNASIPILLSVSGRFLAFTTQQKQLFKCFSVLVLGMFLASLATVNFALSFFIGLLASPLSFIGPSAIPEPGQIKDPARLRAIDLASKVGVQAVSPPVVFLLGCLLMGARPADVLMDAAFGWHVWGLWTQVIVWCVWWPAWLAGTIGLYLD